MDAIETKPYFGDVIETDVGFIEIKDVVYDIYEPGTVVSVETGFLKDLLVIELFNRTEKEFTLTKKEAYYLYDCLIKIADQIFEVGPKRYEITVSRGGSTEFYELDRFEKKWLDLWAFENWKKYVSNVEICSKKFRTGEFYMRVVEPLIAKMREHMRLCIDFTHALYRYCDKEYVKAIREHGRRCVEKFNPIYGMFVRHSEVCSVLKREERFDVRGYDIGVSFRH